MPDMVSSTDSLNDRYLRERGTVFLTGVQALVRFLIEKQRRDRRSGGLVRRTFIAGYEGSPLGGLDLEIRRHLPLLNAESLCVHQPAVNEKIAAAAVHGSQFIGDVDGFWYGKAHGTKWAPDELSLANLSGTGEHSGVVLFSGDDHGAKSSGYPGASEQVLRDVKAAIFYPASVAEILSFAHHALALSRYSGLITALKLVTPLCDGASTVAVDPDEPGIILPDVQVNGRLYRKQFRPVVIATASIPFEQDVADVRLDLARAYARLNRIDRIINPDASGPVGLIATGKSYADLMQALDEIGLEERVRVLKVGLIYPLDPETVRQFADGLETVIVVEEKGPFVEEPVAHALFGSPVRHVYGKLGPGGQRLIPAHGELSPDLLAERLGPVLLEHVPESRIPQRLRELREVAGRQIAPFPRRAAHYCPGCPHSISARAPSGQVAGGEIGCSSLDAYISADGRGVRYIPTMGMGGALFNGMFPFNGNEPLFQNVGDGTILHSGLMTIFSSISHRANITYKILWNHVVAMTGGQDITGQPSLDEFVVVLLGLGVQEVAVVAKYPGQIRVDRARAALGKHQRLEVCGRNDLDRVQQALAARPGVNILIFDQECATETRRRRKRQGIVPERYLFIHEEVCEGCGDCGQQSMCLALYPVETEFGRKTTILQSACNRDESCLKGDCPSFVTVRPVNGARLRRPATPILHETDLTEPAQRVKIDEPYSMYIIGIGGTGVVTVSHLLGFAGMFEGKHVAELNRTGLAQKGGPVESPVIIGDAAPPLSSHIPAGGCDLYLATDLIGGVNPSNLVVASPERTVAVVSRSAIPTAEMVYNPALSFPDVEDLEQTINQYTRSHENLFLDAQGMTLALFGDHILANVFLLGVAYQAGRIPLEAANIERAIRLNGQAVDANLQAFRWGRMAVLDPERVATLVAPPPPSVDAVIQERLDRLGRGRRGAQSSAFYRQALDRIQVNSEEFRRMWAIRVAEVIDYQGLDYARRYVETVTSVYEADGLHGGEVHRFRLTQSVAFVLFKLMAYKDEYEVARLLTGDGERRIRAAFDGTVSLSYNLHPPLLRGMGLGRKVELGPWFRPVLVGLSRLKCLRGTVFDLFGRTAHRREERALIDWYESLIQTVIAHLTPGTYPDAVEVVRAPERVRGYEAVKHRAVVRVKGEVERMVERLEKRWSVVGKNSDE
ncbi:MAG: indolepyruvate ferredoxin oxidoreductase family protein [Candidatus Latescibacteria bacterium]|nr:indolepyruvate ferredoxin oxidoreductase family protein [Candidatus Latescibacterota bacterium]